MLISEAFEKYCKLEIIGRNLSSKTLENYQNNKKLAINYFGDISIGRLDEDAMVSFYQHLLSWQKPDTARLNIICLRCLISFLRRRGEKVMNPEEIRIPKKQKRIINYLEIEEVLRFIDVVAEKRRGYAKINRLRNVAIVELLFASGIRVSELCRLNRDSIRNSQFVVIGKSRNPRPCFISSRASNAISEYLNCRRDNNLALFISNQTSKRITSGNIQRVFRNACKRSDFENVTPHTMRHSFCSYMLDKEVDCIYLSKLMGHVSVDTTMQYAHFKDSKLRKIHQQVMNLE